MNDQVPAGLDEGAGQSRQSGATGEDTAMLLSCWGEEKRARAHVTIRTRLNNKYSRLIQPQTVMRIQIIFKQIRMIFKRIRMIFKWIRKIFKRMWTIFERIRKI